MLDLQNITEMVSNEEVIFYVECLFSLGEGGNKGFEATLLQESKYSEKLRDLSKSLQEQIKTSKSFEKQKLSLAVYKENNAINYRSTRNLLRRYTKLLEKFVVTEVLMENHRQLQELILTKAREVRNTKFYFSLLRQIESTIQIKSLSLIHI